MNKKIKLGFIGTGAYGSAIANVALSNKNEVLMYGINEEELNDIESGFNKKYFSSSEFSNKEMLHTTKKLEELIDKTEIIVLAIPSNSIQKVLEEILKLRPNKKINLINIAKGFENNSKNFFSNFIKKEFKNNLNNFATILGPSFANELFNKNTTIVNVFSENKDFVLELKKIFDNDYFKLIEIKDSFISELFAALKNVLAIGSGILNYYSDSRNTHAAFLTQGIKDIMIIYESLSSDIDFKNVVDFSTLGDVILTCSSEKSRNFSYGRYIARWGLEKANIDFKQTIEGKEAAKILESKIDINSLKISVIKTIIEILNGTKKPERITTFINELR
ncbi:NAD(P)-binding domain-containing protein [Mesomycoplasma molare]|uniref:Glycerol-3-phosphate dehydrogenase n=1 Tax=Mesomycoplasma molare TaxID=171288 RepID=A0ABY5TU20_9BACT|nr:NAD(P)H-dependent glycerol-3-phosphate dehydrogenase [Mesomycoplasma molare]UWD34080.1 NAD(P)-binding domain-containing protein [Mesomycoplasma molare]